MHPLKRLAFLYLPFATAFANPLPDQHTFSANRDSTNRHETILFDGLVFPASTNISETSLFTQFFAFQPERNKLALTAARNIIKAQSGTIGSSRDHIIDERLQLFLAAGVPQPPFAVNVTGCSAVAGTPAALNGRTVFVGDLGECDQDLDNFEDSIATVVGDLCGPEFAVQSPVFSSSDDGFGVISDIDDTVKQSFVLNRRRLIQTTFVEDPKPVPNMPEFYAALAQSLKKPLFVYITGSPFQLYPFLKSFINDVYSSAKGPIFTRELQFSLTNPVQMLGFIGQDSIKEHKLSMIRNLVDFYPNKRWLAIGDSGEHDPEIYGTAYRNHLGSIACIWIRRVEGAKNSPDRFLQAFQGIPNDRYRIYEDSEIPSMSTIDIRRGCI